MCFFLVCLLVVLVDGWGWKSCKSRENKLNCGLGSQFLTPTHPSDAADISIALRSITIRSIIDNCTVSNS